jgi:hypothetical protein
VCTIAPLCQHRCPLGLLADSGAQPSKPAKAYIAPGQTPQLFPCIPQPRLVSLWAGPLPQGQEGATRGGPRVCSCPFWSRPQLGPQVCLEGACLAESNTVWSPAVAQAIGAEQHAETVDGDPAVDANRGRSGRRGRGHQAKARRGCRVRHAAPPAGSDCFVGCSIAGSTR